jgi:hypothetical protein
VRATVNEDPKSVLIRQLKSEVTGLKRQLSQLHTYVEQLTGE